MHESALHAGRQGRLADISDSGREKVSEGTIQSGMGKSVIAPCKSLVHVPVDSPDPCRGTHRKL